MDHSIKKDHVRFRKIVKGKIRENLKNYISKGKIPILKGGKNYKISMPSIETPKFRFGEIDQKGVGQGEGKPGDSLEKQQGDQTPGNHEGDKQLELVLELDELATILGEELELPSISPKGRKNLPSKTDRYKTIGTVGPSSLKHFKRSYKEALKRQIISGTYNPEAPKIIPIKSDMRYRMNTQMLENEYSAVVIYMMDVSGSMGDEQKEIVRTESFWINLWLKSQYKDIAIRYIIHDATAREVDEDTFFKTRESGGTLISSAFKLCIDILHEDYPVDDWNIYAFHFSDGDNWSADDTKFCMKMLDETILPAANLFCYGQVESRYGSGQFYKYLYNAYGDKHKKVSLSKIENKEAILPSIKKFLGKGK